MQIGITFGLMAGEFRKQLRAQHVWIKSVRELEHCDKDNLALSRLAVRGIISERQRDAGRRKLMKRILEQCRMPKAKP